jgi:hypothetical protein
MTRSTARKLQLGEGTAIVVIVRVVAVDVTDCRLPVKVVDSGTGVRVLVDVIGVVAISQS